MRCIMTVSDKDKNIVRQAVFEYAGIMVEALSEVEQGNFVAISRWEEEINPMVDAKHRGATTLLTGLIFDTRIKQILN